MLEGANAKRKKQSASVKGRRRERNVGALESEIEKRTTTDADPEPDQDIDPGTDHGIATGTAREIVIETAIVAVVGIAANGDTASGPLGTNVNVESRRNSRNSLLKRTMRGLRGKRSKIFYGKAKRVLLNNPNSRLMRPSYRLLEGLNQLPPYNLYVVTRLRIQIQRRHPSLRSRNPKIRQRRLRTQRRGRKRRHLRNLKKPSLKRPRKTRKARKARSPKIPRVKRRDDLAQPLLDTIVIDHVAQTMTEDAAIATVLENAVDLMLDLTEGNGADQNTDQIVENVAVLEIVTGLWREIGTFTVRGNEIEVVLVRDLTATGTKGVVHEIGTNPTVESEVVLGGLETIETNATGVAHVPVLRNGTIAEKGRAHLSLEPKNLGRVHPGVDPVLGQLLLVSLNLPMPKPGSKEKSRNASRKRRLIWQRSARLARRVCLSLVSTINGVLESAHPRLREPVSLMRLTGIGLAIATEPTSIASEIEMIVETKRRSATRMIDESGDVVEVRVVVAAKGIKAKIASVTGLVIDTVGRELGIEIAIKTVIVTSIAKETVTAKQTAIEIATEIGISAAVVTEVMNHDATKAGTGGIGASSLGGIGEIKVAVADEAAALVSHRASHYFTI